MKLQRPLVVLDLETTGTWIDKDRIIEIGMIQCHPDGGRFCYEKKVNPGILIPQEVIDVTGISNEDVKEAPYFRQIAGEVLEFLSGADLAGFNVERFDLPLLAREFSDAGIKFDYSQRAVYDAQKIYHLHERRDLTAAYNFYCHKELEGAHSAIVDSEATLAVLSAQLEKYGQGEDRLDVLLGFDYKQRTDFYDVGRRFRWWNGELYMMFGKYARKEHLKTIAQKDRKYLEWILTQNFSDDIKDLIEGALEGHFPQPPGPSHPALRDIPPEGSGYQNELF